MDGVVDHEARVRSDDEEQGLEGHELVVADRRLLDRRQRRALADDAAHVVADQQARADLRVGADLFRLRKGLREERAPRDLYRAASAAQAHAAGRRSHGPSLRLAGTPRQTARER